MRGIHVQLFGGGHGMLVTRDGDEVFTGDDVQRLSDRMRAVMTLEERSASYVHSRTTGTDPMMLVLAEERERRGLERVDISNILRWSTSERIREYEEGTVLPKIDTLRDIAFLLGHRPVMQPMEAAHAG